LIPDFQACLVCDAVRPELNGKTIILGFFGICPNVTINIPRLDQPSPLTFLLLGGPGDGTFEAVFDVVDEGGFVVASTTLVTFRAVKNAATHLANGFVLIFGHPGTFAFRCFIDQQERFRGEFRIAEGPVQQPAV
jgi:hypothetical protein